MNAWPRRLGAGTRRRAGLALAALLVAAAMLLLWRRTSPRAPVPRIAPSAPTTQSPPPPASVEALYLPDGGDAPLVGGARPELTLPTPSRPSRRCPPEMVDVEGHFCIDRWEVRLVDDASGKLLSPHYSPKGHVAKRAFEKWVDALATEDSPAMPALPAWQRAGNAVPRAESRAGVLPSGYLDGLSAADACHRSGKRLCSATEWVTACKGERATKFPYGGEYRQGVCNVFRADHPAQVLHGNASQGHDDPRLGLVRSGGSPLLHRTGEDKDCASRWGDDAIYDMVGNLDEWIDDAEGTFLGGFFSRNTREGCDARVEAHPVEYQDYSLGTRCCL